MVGLTVFLANAAARAFPGHARAAAGAQLLRSAASAGSDRARRVRTGRPARPCGPPSFPRPTPRHRRRGGTAHELPSSPPTPTPAPAAPSTTQTLSLPSPAAGRSRTGTGAGSGPGSGAGSGRLRRLMTGDGPPASARTDRGRGRGGRRSGRRRCSAPTAGRLSAAPDGRRARARGDRRRGQPASVASSEGSRAGQPRPGAGGWRSPRGCWRHLQLALRAAEITDGAVDPTLGAEPHRPRLRPRLAASSTRVDAGDAARDGGGIAGTAAQSADVWR